MAIYETLESLGISLPPVTAPVAAFVPWVRSGDLVYISGHIAKKDGGAPWHGQLGVVRLAWPRSHSVRAWRSTSWRGWSPTVTRHEGFALRHPRLASMAMGA